jgi:predicted RNase H-like HicB family nuclease
MQAHSLPLPALHKQAENREECLALTQEAIDVIRRLELLIERFWVVAQATRSA